MARFEKTTTTTVTTVKIDDVTIPELNELDASALDRLANHPADVGEDGSAPVRGPLDPALAEWLRNRRRASGPARDRFEALLAEVLGWGNTAWQLGKSTTTADGVTGYVMLRAVPSNGLGAAAYVNPGHALVTLRLEPSHARGFAHAETRNIKGPYRVRIRVTDDDTVKEAAALIKLAVDRITSAS